MIFEVSNEGMQWSLDFGPDAVNLTGKHLVQEMTISSWENLLQAWILLLFQKQDFLDNHSAQIPITSNENWTYETEE